jgi:hypothetical protein
VLSISEPQTEAIRKGKAAKPTEFGKLVKIQEAEAGFITDYTVCPTRVPDQERWGPSLRTHQALFGQPPRLAVADDGFASAANERTATDLGVKKVMLPRGCPTPTAPPPPRAPRRPKSSASGTAMPLGGAQSTCAPKQGRIGVIAGEIAWTMVVLLAAEDKPRRPVAASGTTVRQARGVVID